MFVYALDKENGGGSPRLRWAKTFRPAQAVSPQPLCLDYMQNQDKSQLEFFNDLAFAPFYALLHAALLQQDFAKKSQFSIERLE